MKIFLVTLSSCRPAKDLNMVIQICIKNFNINVDDE